MTKINIAASQNENGLFNLVISKVTEIEEQEPVRENVIKTELTLEDLKSEINAL
jgi:alpha-acetolactate decarboxylase